MVVKSVSEHISGSHVTLKDVNLALRNNFALLESLDESDPKRAEILAENEKLFEKGFKISGMRL